MSASALELAFPETPGTETGLEFSWFDIAADTGAWNDLVGQGRQRMFNMSYALEAHVRKGKTSKGIVCRLPNGVQIPIGVLIKKLPHKRILKSLAFPSLASTGEPGLVVELVAWLFTQQIDEVQFGSFISGAEGYQLPATGVTKHERLEFEWDLQGPVEERLRALRNNHKRKLRRLLTQPFELRKIDRLGAEQMTRLRLQWSRRRSMPSGFRDVVRMYQYHRFLHQKLTSKGVASLYGLYDKERRLQSLAYMLEVDGIAFYMIGASSVEGYKSNTSLRLFWDLAKYYSEREYKLLHLGGVPAEAARADHDEHGVFRFKAGFGIEPLIRTSLSIQK